MPLYEYQCESCELRFEKIQKFSDPPVDVCPNCGGKVRKLPASPAIQFKGSGFYITDYPKKSSTEASKAGSPKSSTDAPAAPSASPSDASSKPADTTAKKD